MPHCKSSLMGLLQPNSTEVGPCKDPVSFTTHSLPSSALGRGRAVLMSLNGNLGINFLLPEENPPGLCSKSCNTGNGFRFFGEKKRRGREERFTVAPQKGGQVKGCQFSDWYSRAVLGEVWGCARLSPDCPEGWGLCGSTHPPNYKFPFL